MGLLRGWRSDGKMVRLFLDVRRGLWQSSLMLEVAGLSSTRTRQTQWDGEHGYVIRHSLQERLLDMTLSLQFSIVICMFGTKLYFPKRTAPRARNYDVFG